jgi:MFS family permease
MPVPEKPASGPIAAHTPSSLFLWVLSLSAFCMNLGYGIVIPILEDLAKRCGGSSGEVPGTAEYFTAMAIALMGFNLAKILGEVPGGIFSDRIGDRVVLATSLLIYAVSVVMLIAARNYVPFIAARFIEGLATGISYPAMTSVLLKHSPQERLGRNMSIAMGIGVAGIVLGPVVAGPLTKLPPLGPPDHPWISGIDWPLYAALFFTIIVFAFSVAWFAVAAEKQKRAEMNREAERKAVVADAVLAAAPGPTSSSDEKDFLAGIYHEFGVIGRFARSGVFLAMLSPLVFAKMVLTAWMVVLFAHVKVVFHTVDTETTVHYVGFLTGALKAAEAVRTW